MATFGDQHFSHREVAFHQRGHYREVPLYTALYYTLCLFLCLENDRGASAEGKTGHGDAGASQSGAIFQAFQPEICQNENKTIVSHLLQSLYFFN